MTIATSTTYRSEAVNNLLSTIGESKPMTAEEEIEAFTEYKANPTEALRDKIAKANYRFVFSIAKAYAKNDDVCDYFVAGCIGMLEAIDAFDVEMGNKFISFAVHYIRREMSMECTRMSIVRKTNEHKVGSKANKFRDTFFKENMREATDEEVLDYLAEVEGITLKYADEIANVGKQSIADAVGEDGNVEENGDFAMLTASTNLYEKEVEDEATKATIKCLMSALTIKEAEVIKYLYLKEMDIDSVADRMELTTERVRQLSKSALAKMKSKGVNMGIAKAE